MISLMPARRQAQPGWIAENIPRRMRALKPEEVEIRLSRQNTAQLVSNMKGSGAPSVNAVQVTNAMSLRLTAPKGGFSIESHSPETQWVFSADQLDDNEVACWCYTITPLQRGVGMLRLTLSHKQIGPDGMIADRTLPDQTIDVKIRANVGRLCVGAAGWTATIITGAALGAYFDDLAQMARNLP